MNESVVGRGEVKSSKPFALGHHPPSHVQKNFHFQKNVKGGHMALTAKKKAFAQAKFDGANNKEAAIFAGCSPETASQAGSRMAKDSDVIAQLERLKNVKDVNRDVKPNPKPIVTKNDIDNVGSQADPLKFLEEIWTDPVEDMKLRMDAAKAALPYFHGKVADKGKKQSQEEQAHAAAKGTGRFATRAARKANYS